MYGYSFDATLVTVLLATPNTQPAADEFVFGLTPRGRAN